ncbi:MAG: nucleoside triphosphate pyrophosphohydrolase [Candidatus Hodarchaeota archaeon]
MTEKLVRDKIPDLIKEDGGAPIIRIADPDEFDILLRKKLVEESEEFVSSGNSEEIADILEVIFAILRIRSLDMAQIESMRIEKKLSRGGFEKMYVLNMFDA